MQNSLNTLADFFCRNGIVLVIGSTATASTGQPEQSRRHRYLDVLELTKNAVETALMTVPGEQETVLNQKRVLIILDRIWDSPPSLNNEAWGWESRREFYRHLNTLLPDGCEVILIAEDAANLRNLKLLMRTLIWTIQGNRRNSAFSGRYIAELKAEGFHKIDRFHVVPSLENIGSLISARRLASLVYLRRVHKQAMTFPKNPRAWPAWLAIWAGLGQRVIPTQLIWAHH